MAEGFSGLDESAGDFNMSFCVSEAWTGKRSADGRWILGGKQKKEKHFFLYVLSLEVMYIRVSVLYTS